jgi:hypothetical protein
MAPRLPRSGDLRTAREGLQRHPILHGVGQAGSLAQDVAVELFDRDQGAPIPVQEPGVIVPPRGIPGRVRGQPQ